MKVSARTGSTLRKQKSGKVERKLEKRKELGDNPAKGTIWYLVYCCIKASAMIASSLIFTLNPNL